MSEAERAPHVAAATRVFIAGFCFERSFTHPYVARQVGPVWVMQDGPRSRGEYRTEEWVVSGLHPEAVDRLVRRNASSRFAISVIRGLDEDGEKLRAGFQSCGYRLGATESLMVHELRDIPEMEAVAEVRRVENQALADQLTKAARRRQILPEHLGLNAPLRQYAALIERQIVGWVRSIAVENSAWCCNMYVATPFRRRGIAKAMLSRMLRDDRDEGATASVLLASHAGAKLYPTVGYRAIGELLLFTPQK